MRRVNGRCGQRPTQGWRNFDNSLSLRLSKIPFLPGVLHKLGLLESSQYEFIKFARENEIECGDATRALPLPDESCEVLYSCHMIEHLDKKEADRFLKEVFRVLCPGGIMRIAAPPVLADGPCRQKAGSLIAATAVTTTGKYSGRHPAITALMATISAVKKLLRSGMPPIILSGSIDTVSSIDLIRSAVGGTIGNPSVHSF